MVRIGKRVDTDSIQAFDSSTFSQSFYVLIKGATGMIVEEIMNQDVGTASKSIQLKQQSERYVRKAFGTFQLSIKIIMS